MVFGSLRQLFSYFEAIGTSGKDFISLILIVVNTGRIFITEILHLHVRICVRLGEPTIVVELSPPVI